ncbi:NAD(P)/FAD-dependent oxidoreductase [Alsobacter sp. R-9]
MAPLDAFIVGGGPAGLAAALYLARFGRRFVLVDAGDSRARRIPCSRNIPFFPDGIPGEAILDLQRQALANHDAYPARGEVNGIERRGEAFAVSWRETAGARTLMLARRVILATGGADRPPPMDGADEALRNGLLRYCPICDGFEATGKDIGVLGRGASGLGEALFLARAYSRRVSLLSLEQPLTLTDEERSTAEHGGVAVVERPVRRLRHEGGRLAAVFDDAGERQFDTVYAALGRTMRSELARFLGARCDGGGGIIVDSHGRTSVEGLYAIGDVISGLDQVVVAMGHAAIAATDVHNRSEGPAAFVGSR